MGACLFYIFESSFCLTILYFIFRMFFRTDTLFRTNRLMLLAGTMCCMLLPFIQLDMNEGQLWQQPATIIRNKLIHAEEPAASIALVPTHPAEQPSISGSSGEGKGVEGEALPVYSSFHFSWSRALGILYLAGAIVTLLFFALSTWRMLCLIRRYPAICYGNYKLVVCPEKIPSFSWGNTIVLSQEDYEKYGDKVLLHEQMHLHYRHTFDLLWMEMLLVLHWFNPTSWLLMRDMRELHEFEADNGVLSYGIDATQYQLLLVKKSVGTRLYSMANGFNHSKLKNRINMMLKKRTNNWARLKLLLFVPVAAVMLMAFARPEVKETVKQIAKPESVKQDITCDEEWDQLNEFFASKRRAIYGDDEPKMIKEADVHSFFVNIKNQTMLDDEWLRDTDWNANAVFLRTQLTDLLKKEYQKSKLAKTPFRKELLVRYDYGSHIGALCLYLNTIKEVYLQFRKEIAVADGITESEIDKVLPVLVTIEPPRVMSKTTIKNAKLPLPIEVTLFDPDGNRHKLLKDITLVDLEKEINAYMAEAGDKITVSFKVPKDMWIGTVTDVKETIRKAYKKPLHFVIGVSDKPKVIVTW